MYMEVQKVLQLLFSWYRYHNWYQTSAINTGHLVVICMNKHTSLSYIVILIRR